MVKLKTNTEKKLISFSKLELINKLVKDEAEINNCTESAVFEAHLLDSLLPKHPSVRFWVEHILYSDGGIGKTLQAVFEEASTGINYHAKHANLLPIVKFAKAQQCCCNTIPTGKEPELHHCRSQMKSVVDRFEYLLDKATEWNEKSTLSTQLEFARHLYDELCNEPEQLRYSNIYLLLLGSWDDFKDWQITYRLLADLASMEKGWIDNAETRTELVKLLTDVSAEWNN